MTWPRRNRRGWLVGLAWRVDGERMGGGQRGRMATPEGGLLYSLSVRRDVEGSIRAACGPRSGW